MMARVLGVDVGFVATGLVLAEGSTILAAAVLRTERRTAKRTVRVADDDAERCTTLARGIAEFIETWQPAGAVVELPTGGAQGARANRCMGMATGCTVAVLELCHLPCEWVTPQAVKHAAIGRRDASKAEVETAVQTAFTWQVPLPVRAGERDDVCDAAGALLAARDGMLLRLLTTSG